jgi:hypothetical protein
VLDAKDISDDQIELMGPAEKDDHPSTLLGEKSLTLLHIWPIVCAPANNLNTVLLLHHVRGHPSVSLPSLSSPPPSSTPHFSPTLTPVHMYTPPLSVPSLGAKL